MAAEWLCIWAGSTLGRYAEYFPALPADLADTLRLVSDPDDRLSPPTRLGAFPWSPLDVFSLTTCNQLMAKLVVGMSVGVSQVTVTPYVTEIAPTVAEER